HRLARVLRRDSAVALGDVRDQAQPLAAADALCHGRGCAPGSSGGRRDPDDDAEPAPLRGRPLAIRHGQRQRGFPRRGPAVRLDRRHRLARRRSGAGPGLVMQFLQPATWSEALAMKAANPEATPIAGGTDVMVEINLDHRRPTSILDLTRIRELGEWGPVDGMLRIGAGVTYTRLIDELGDRLPGLAMASRTVGSPQIRNRGTVGGNLGTASPAGDALPPLLASDAWVELASKAGTRHVSVREFFTGPKRNAMRKDELIRRFWSSQRQDRSSSPRSGRAMRWSSPCALLRYPSIRVTGVLVPASAPPGRHRSGRSRRRTSSRASSTGRAGGL